MNVNTRFNPVQIENQLKSEDREEKRLKDACKDFEAIFTGMMLKSMRSTVPEDSLFGKSNQKEIFQSMFDQEIANDIAHSDKSLGLGDALYQKLIRKK